MRHRVRSVVLKQKNPAIWKCYYARIQPQTTKGEFPDVRIPRQHFLKAPLMYSRGGKLMMPCEFLLHSAQTSDSEMLVHMHVSLRAHEKRWRAPFGFWVCVYGEELEDVHIRPRGCTLQWKTFKNPISKWPCVCLVKIINHVDGRLY